MNSPRSVRLGPRRRGRRPAGADTKAQLLNAAREVFSEQGFEGATVRAIAARAGLDASMVNHWFGGKQGLFIATIELPFDITTVLERILQGDPDTIAERMVRNFLSAWDGHGERFAAIVRSVSSQQMAAALLRDFVTTTVFVPITRHITTDRAEFRASLCASQMIGMAMMRYVLCLEPLASAGVDQVVAAVAPGMRFYLTGDIG